MNTIEAKRVLENAKKLSEHIAEMCKDENNQINNQETLSTGMFAMALLATFFEESPEQMCRLLVVLMAASKEVLGDEESPYLQ